MRGPLLLVVVGGSIALAAACSGGGGGAAGTSPPASPTPAGTLPLMDMPAGSTYLGFTGGLYATGNVIDSTHRTEGLAAANAVQPLDANGNPSASGKVVLISVGM